MSELYRTASELAEMRANLVTAPAVTGAWEDHFLPAANAALNYNSNPPPGGSASYLTDSAWRNLLYTPGLNDGHAAYRLAMVYALTEGNATYADATRNAWGNKSRDIIMDWVNTYSQPAGNVGHYVAEPVGFMLKGFISYTLVEDRFSAAQKASFLSWCSYFVAHAKQQAPGAAAKDPNITSGPWGNGIQWSRAMGCWAGALRGDDTIWDWNWNSPGTAIPYGWTSLLRGIIASNGQIGEETRRQSIGYALYTWLPLVLIADLHAHYAPPGVDRMRLWQDTPSPVRGLLSASNYYAPYLSTNNAFPYAANDGSYASGNQADTRSQYRAAFETVRNVFPTSTQIQTAVAFGGDNVREDNDDQHILSWHAITGQTSYITGTGPPPGTAGVVSVENDQLKLVNPDAKTGYVGLNSLADYDLTESYFGARLVDAGAQSADRECFIEVSDGTNKLTLAVKNNQVEARKNGVVQGVGTPYVAATHRHFQIESSGGTSRWRYSTDGANYSNIHTEANPFTLTAVELRIRSGNINSTTTTTVLWDDVNAVVSGPVATRGPINLLLGMAG